MCRHAYDLSRPSAQLRYLPALEHARRENMQQFRSGALKWLVQLDDDSVVNVQNLLHLLARHNPMELLQLGDFSWFYENETHWRRPYACGGAGTVFSAAAVVATDFGGCAHRFSRACLQSDWMIGMCAGEHQVGVAEKYSCQCGALVNDDKRIPEFTRFIQQTSGCSFMHVYPGAKHANRRFIFQNSKALWKRSLKMKNAILHVSPSRLSWSLFHSPHLWRFFKPNSSLFWDTSTPSLTLASTIGGAAFGNTMYIDRRALGSPPPTNAPWIMKKKLK